MTKLWKLLGALVLLAACTPPKVVSPVPTPTAAQSPLVVRQVTTLPAVTPVAGTAVIKGQVSADTLKWTGENIYIYAAPFSSIQGDQEGFYMLEPTIHPKTTVNPDGAFQFTQVPPGAYVLVVGPTPEEAVAIQESGHAKVFRVADSQVLDIGKVSLK